MKKPFIDVKGDLRGVRARIAKIKRPLMSVYDMYMAGHRVVFDRDEFGNDISHAVHKETGQVAKFTLRNRTWDLDAKLVPHEDVRLQSNAATQNRKLRLCPFNGPVCAHPGCKSPECH